MKAVQKVLLYLFICIFLSLNTFGGGVLDSCQDLSTTGLWYMEDDLVDATNTSCITLSVDDIIIDCQDHWINTSNSAVGNAGITLLFNDNITIQNCKFGNWGDSGFESAISSDSSSFDNTYRNLYFNNNNRGIQPRGNNNVLDNITVVGGGMGFSLYSLTNSIVTNINVYSSTTGLYLFGANNNNLSNILSNSNSFPFRVQASDNNTFNNFNVSGNTLGLEIYAGSDGNIYKNGFLYSNTNSNLFFQDATVTNNLLQYVYVENASMVDGSADWNLNGNILDNIFWDNISLFDPCDETYTYDVCDNNPKVYVQQSEQLRIEMLEYADETVTYSPLETATGQYAGTSENFSHYNITGYLIVSNNNPNSETLSDIYLSFDHSSNITLPIAYSGRTGTWLDNTPADGSLYLHIPELRGGENLTYIYSVNISNVKPPLNVTSNYSDFKLLAGDNFTIQDTLSNNFDAATYQGDVCIYDIIFNQSASSINFSGTFYDFTFNSNSVNGSDYNHVITSSDNRTQTWDVFNGGCLYNNNNPYITYNMSTPNNIPTSQPYEAVNTSISYTIDTTLSQFRLTNIRAIGEEGINFEKQIVEPSDAILYGSNVTWNVSGGFRSDSDITYDLEQITYWVSQRNYDGSFTDPNSFDNDSISGEQLNISFYPNNLTNTLNPWVTPGWLFNYSDIPSPIVWMDVNLTIRNDNYQLINRSVTRNGDNYHIKEIYLIIGYWLEVEKNISLIGENTYQIRIDVHNKGNQVTPQDSIVTIYDFVPSNFNISSGFVYSNSTWYSTSRANNSVTGIYNGTLQQWAIIPTNNLNTSFAQGPSKNINTTWSATFNVTGQGDYTLLDIFITGLDPQKVDGAGSTRAVIVEEFVDKLKSTEGIFAAIAFVLLSLSFLI